TGVQTCALPILRSDERKTLTAGTFQFFLSSERRPQGAMDWDLLVQGRGEPGREASGATRTGSKPDTVSPSHEVGGALPGTKRQLGSRPAVPTRSSEEFVDVFR